MGWGQISLQGSSWKMKTYHRTEYLELQNHLVKHYTLAQLPAYMTKMARGDPFCGRGLSLKTKTYVPILRGKCDLSTRHTIKCRISCRYSLALIRGGWALGPVKVVLFFLSFSFIFFLSFLFFFLFAYPLNQTKYRQHLLFVLLCTRSVKLTSFLLFFGTFKLVSLDNRITLLNSFPLLSFNIVGSWFIPVPDSFLLGQQEHLPYH